MPYFPSASGGTSLPVVDTTSIVKGSSDDTKLARLEVDGLTTGTTRVLTVPDSNITLAGLGLAQTWTASQTLSASVLIGSGSMSVGTSGIGVLVLGNSTLPTSSPADEVQVVAADYTAGDSRLLILSETNAGGIWVGNGTLEAKAPASGAGNSLTLRGSAAVSGNTNGGDVVVQLVAKSGSGVDGKLTVKAATASPGANLQEWQNSAGTMKAAIGSTGNVRFDPTYPGLTPDGSSGIYFFSSVWIFDVSGQDYNGAGSSGFQTRVGYGFATAVPASPDLLLKRAAAAVLQVTNGSTGTGSVLSTCLVEANTAGSGSPNILLSTESRTVLTNEGATAQNYHTLPSAAAGYDFSFVVQDSDGIRVVAAAGDTIRDVATVSTTAGYIQSTTVGSVIRLIAVNNTEWIVVAKQGTWTIDS